MNTTLSFPIKGQTILNQAKDLVPGFAGFPKISTAYCPTTKQP
jgi:hypothetical protein